jgi:hypothetical protein
MNTAAITAETKFVAYTLVTDTRVYEIVGRTAKTLKLRPTSDGERNIRDTLVDGGTSDECPPVIWTEQVPCPDAKVITVRLRQDGTYRTWRTANPLRPCTEIEGVPCRRTDYRF